MNTNLRVGSKRIISIRYRMRNQAGEMLVDTFEGEPANFLYGSGDILPGLEGPLTGMRIGEQKTFTLSGDHAPELDQTYFFDVIVDDIRWAPDPEMKPLKNPASDCGPDCDC
jgi:hypothetical protein